MGNIKTPTEILCIFFLDWQKFDSILYWNTVEKKILLYMSCSNAIYYTPVKGKSVVSSKITSASVLRLRKITSRDLSQIHKITHTHTHTHTI